MPPADIDLATDIRATILVQSPRGGQAILWVIALLTLIAFFWAYFSEVEEVTRGQGKVIPSHQVQVVQNLEGGILSEIHVNTGDLVKKDQLLLRIDETRFSSSVLENRASYLALMAKMARLQAESSDTPFKIPAEVVKEKPEIGKWEQDLYESRKRELNKTIGILQEQVTQRNQELKELRVKQDELTRTSALLQKEVEVTKPLVGQGAVSEVEMLRLERQASQMHGEIEGIKQAIPRAASKLQETNWAVEEAKLNFHNKAKAELNEVMAKLEGISASSVALEDRLNRTAVRSPVNGTIKQILVNTVGGVIQPGMNLIEIVPLEDSLMIEAQVKPADIAFLRPNQKAMIKFTAYDFTIYGGLEAELENISADSITDEKGNSFFLIRLRTTKNYLGTPEKPLPIIPGMVATVDILTGKKTVLTYLLKPALRAKHMALRER
ncbi:MAG: hemolysin secretion protein D [Deltaproteobacteria bacterium RIFOXYD12_FULL_57_12]|nr:MAG: hemolysin secretion protein D [Deltaproteobacteria bacterium RIFOXYD12_FULL_57_12]